MHERILSLVAAGVLATAPLATQAEEKATTTGPFGQHPATVKPAAVEGEDKPAPGTREVKKAKVKAKDGKKAKAKERLKQDTREKKKLEQQARKAMEKELKEKESAFKKKLAPLNREIRHRTREVLKTNPQAAQEVQEIDVQLHEFQKTQKEQRSKHLAAYKEQSATVRKKYKEDTARMLKEYRTNMARVREEYDTNTVELRQYREGIITTLAPDLKGVFVETTEIQKELQQLRETTQ